MNCQPDREFQAFLSQGKFMLQRCRTTGRHVFFPRIAEPGTGNRDLEWVEADGRGSIYSVTIVRPKPPLVPYNVVLVDLKEGPRLMSRVDGIDPAAVRIGLEVRARVIVEDDKPLLVFEPSMPQAAP